MSYWVDLFQKGIANSSLKPPAPKIEILSLSTGKEMERKHPFSHTVTTHHKDGSHTQHHIHEKHGFHHDTPERDGDVKGAQGNHDAMMDHMMEHTSAPNPGEGNDESNQPMAAAGAPPPVAAAPPAAAGV